jgi:hypothetical protein
MMKSLPLRMVVITALASCSLSAWAGPKWDISDDSYLQLGFLGQVHATYSQDATDQEDIYLRRARIILSGQVTDGVKFFAETDNDNAGKNGTTAVSTDIQDAFVDVRLATNHWVEAGLILLPFSFETKSSAGSLLGLDYNSEVIKLVNTFVWRDYGAEFHGNFGKKFAYRAGIFDGYDDTASTKNPEAPLRYTGHVALNLIGEVETGWFYSQERLADKPYLSIGVGGDYQEEATRKVSTNKAPDTITDNEAIVVDFQSGWKMGPLAATMNGGWFNWDNAAFKGETLFVEAGLRHDQVQVTGKLSGQEPEKGDSKQDTTVGVNYFMKKHNARCGLEYRWGDSADQYLLGLQFLL